MKLSLGNSLLLLAVAAQCHVEGNTNVQEYEITIIGNETVCNVDERFLSIAIGLGQARKEWKIIGFTSQRLKTLLKALKPAYFRVGGSDANFLKFGTKPTGPDASSVDTETTTVGRPGQGQTPYQPNTLPQQQQQQHAQSQPQQQSGTGSNPPTSQGPNGSSGQHTGNSGDKVDDDNDDSNGNNNENNNPYQYPQLQNAPSPRPLPQSSPGIWPSSKSETAFPVDDSATGYENEGKEDLDDEGPRQDRKQHDNPQKYRKMLENLLDRKREKQYLMQHDSGNMNPFPNSGDMDAEEEEKNSHIIRKRTETGRYHARRTMEVSKHDKDNFWLSAANFDKMANLVKEVGLDLIFDLNAFTRKTDKTWDSSNALKILNHVAERGYKVGWELGNEPNRNVKYGKDKVINGTQAGDDFIRLREILRKDFKYGSTLIGPDVTKPKSGGSSERFLTEFLIRAGTVVDAVTWHQYYVDGDDADLNDFTSPDTLELFRQQILLAKRMLGNTNTNKPLWLGETSSAWGGGAPGLSDRYAVAFTFLDKLGLSGLYCNTVVMRQSILAGNYALLNNDFSPRPDYWLTLLHKKLVGARVLHVQGGDGNVRIYAHCTKGVDQSLHGTVTMMAMNLHKTTNAKITLQAGLRQKSIKQYLMTAPGNDLTSKEVLLNGKKIQMTSDTKLPDLSPEQVTQPLNLPPLSYAFYVIDQADVEVCKIDVVQNLLEP